MTDLLNCPFCGGEAIIHDFKVNKKTLWCISCHDCEIEQANYDSEQEAIEAWNHRTAAWHTGDPAPDRTTEYITKDRDGIIGGRLWHPGKGWGRVGRPQHEDVAEWMEVPHG